MSKDFLDDRRKSLEDEFFHKENQKDMARFRAKLAQQTTKAELRKASGMEDDAVLDKLVELGLSADTVTALSLVPLLRVAWADGEVQSNEREAILQGARGKGIEEDSPGAELLAGWLDRKPDEALFEAWASYIKSLRAELTEEQSQTLHEQVLRFAKAVAESAGGFLGFGSVSKEEKTALAWIESVFDAEVVRREPAAAPPAEEEAEAEQAEAEQAEEEQAATGAAAGESDDKDSSEAASEGDSEDAAKAEAQDAAKANDET